MPELPEPPEALLVRTAEGNPFFLEEVLRSLQETGTVRAEGDRLRLAPRLAEHVVPDTVQDVIRARIQRLPDARGSSSSWHPSSAGSSPGGSSIGSPARTTSPSALRELKAFELIHETSAFPELTYAFRHALTHDVAYYSLPVERRREPRRRRAGHRRAPRGPGGRAIRGARAPLRGIRGVGEGAGYLSKAAEKATQAFAIREALTLYDRALEVAGNAGPARV